jgi:ABC-2 type transport system permease protein
MILTLAAREIRSGLVTPLLWVLLGVGQVVLAWIFLQVVENFSGLDAEQRLAPLTQELCLNLFGSPPCSPCWPRRSWLCGC